MLHFFFLISFSCFQHYLGLDFTFPHRIHTGCIFEFHWPTFVVNCWTLIKLSYLILFHQNDGILQSSIEMLDLKQESSRLPIRWKIKTVVDWRWSFLYLQFAFQYVKISNEEGIYFSLTNFCLSQGLSFWCKSFWCNLLLHTLSNIIKFLFSRCSFCAHVYMASKPSSSLASRMSKPTRAFE